jgi:Xaa-Pro aminopeptidase
MPEDHWPTLSLAERDRRWSLIRREMESRDLDCLIIAGNQDNWAYNFASVRYVTGIGDMGWALFPREGDPIRYVWWTLPTEVRAAPETHPLTQRILDRAGRRRSPRNPWALDETWVHDVRQFGPEFSKAIVAGLRDLGVERGRLGLVGTSQDWEPEGLFPVTTYLRLVEALPDADIVFDVGDVIERLRLVKSAEEIACMDKAAEIADAAIDCMREVAAEGVDEARVYAQTMATMLERGSERYAMIWWTCGRTPTHTRLFAPVNRPLERNDVIIPEFTPRYGGYVAHPHQPAVVGEPYPEMEEMFELLRATRDDALSRLRPGVTMQEQFDLLTKPLEEAGYSWLHCPWHGLGLAGLEWPNAPFWGGTEPVTAAPMDMRWEEGMTVAYEPMISTPDRKVSMAIGDTVVVTADGARRLGQGVDDLIRL